MNSRFFLFYRPNKFWQKYNVRDKIATNSIYNKPNPYTYRVHEFRVEKTDGFRIFSDFFRIPLPFASLTYIKFYPDMQVIPKKKMLYGALYIILLY